MTRDQQINEAINAYDAVALEALSVRGDWADGRFVGYDYDAQRWIEQAVRS